MVGRFTYGTGLGVVAVGVIVCGAVPGMLLPGDAAHRDLTIRTLLAAPSLGGWLLWGGGVLMGGALAWVDRGFRPRVSLWLDAVHDGVLVDWAYALIVGAVEQGLALIRVVDAIVGGRAAMLWSSVFLLIVVLLIGT